MKEIFRKDYKSPPFLIETTKLKFQIDEASTIVFSDLKILPNLKKNGETQDLFLNGRNDIKLKYLKLNGENYLPSSKLHENGLIIKDVPTKPFQLEIAVEIKPQNNTRLEGLYKSNGIYCTQVIISQLLF